MGDPQAGGWVVDADGEILQRDAGAPGEGQNLDLVVVGTGACPERQGGGRRVGTKAALGVRHGHQGLYAQPKVGEGPPEARRGTDVDALEISSPDDDGAGNV